MDRIETNCFSGNTKNYLEIPTTFKNGSLDIKLCGDVQVGLGVKGASQTWRYVSALTLSYIRCLTVIQREVECVLEDHYPDHHERGRLEGQHLRTARAVLPEARHRGHRRPGVLQRPRGAPTRQHAADGRPRRGARPLQEFRGHLQRHLPRHVRVHPHEPRLQQEGRHPV